VQGSQFKKLQRFLKINKPLFRMISKILHSVGEVVGKPVTMEEVCDVRAHWKTLTDLGSGKTFTENFNYEKVSL